MKNKWLILVATFSFSANTPIIKHLSPKISPCSSENPTISFYQTAGLFSSFSDWLAKERENTELIDDDVEKMIRQNRTLFICFSLILGWLIYEVIVSDDPK